MSSALDQSTRFLNALFGGLAGPAALIAVWSLPSKKTTFHASPESAAADASSRDGDVYFGVGLMKPGIRGGRGGAVDVVALPALWLDVDYGPNHKGGKTRPGAASDATRLLEAITPPPTITVNSGGGFHCYWLLKEPLLITGDIPMSRATNASRRWSKSAQKVALDTFGWHVDSVWDISRVLRVPGTINRKYEPPRPVTMSEIGERYALDDLLDGALDVEVLGQLAASSGHVVSGAIRLVAGAAPDADMKDAVMEDPRFAKTWRRERVDLTDPSDSGYDLSVASMLAMAGWPDQEIANALIQFRRQNGSEAKALRLDYVTRTIAKARAGSMQDSATQELNRLPEGPRAIEPDDHATKAETIELLRKALCIPISRWIQHGEEKPTYSIILEDGTDVEIGNVDYATNQRRMFNRIYAVCGTMPAGKKPATWRSILGRLAEIREVISNVELTRVGRLKAWLDDYMSTTQVYGMHDDRWWAGMAESSPFVRDGVAWVNVSDLRRHVHRVLGVRAAECDIHEMLRVAGAEQRSVKKRVKTELRSGNRQLHRRYWRIPNEVYSVNGEAADAETDY